MRIRLLTAITASALTLTVIAVAPSPVQAQEPRNTGITGTWVGTQQGFENGTYVSREVRFVFTKTKGVAVTGTKSWREPNGEWSQPEGFQGALMKSGEFRAVDEDGYLFGELVTPVRIRGTYMEAGTDQAVLIQDLKKITR